MTVKHGRVTHPRLFYAFVDLETSPPTSYILPSEVVADVVTRSHQTWLRLPGPGGRKHNDNPMRRVTNNYGFPVDGYPAGWLDSYRERWDSLISSLGDETLDEAST